MYISSKMRKLLILIIFLFFKVNFALSEIVNEIQVKGNNRVSAKTIINFSEIKKGDDTTKKILNTSLKKLYDTNFFELVEFKLEDNILTIQVSEYPVVAIKTSSIKLSLFFISKNSNTSKMIANI